MTFQEIVDNAKSRAVDFGATFPTTARVLYRRIEIRQQEIFSGAGRVNPDYFGVAASGTVDSTTLAVNLKDMEAAVDVDPASSVTRVEVLDPGTHPTLAVGDEISVVPVSDIKAALAPRMTLRNFVLTSVGQEVAGVATVLVFYGYRPANKTTPLDGTEDAELPDVYQELLVIDLVKWMLKQTLEIQAETKAAAIAVLSEEEEETMGAFMAEVVDYGGAQVSRFGDVRGSQRT